MSDIDDLLRQFHDTQVHAGRLLTTFSPAQCNWRSHAAAWSIAECVQHLTITARSVQRAMEPAVEQGRERGQTGAGPFRYGWFSRWFEAEMEPPPKRRMKAPPVFAVTAGSSLDTDAVLSAFGSAGTTWRELLEAARGLGLRRIKVTSPAMRLFRFPIGAYWRINAAHERRHLWQADKVAAAPGFLQT